ncbi:hypothetical protein C0991_009287 [Blastosporella zonata]|nr:hypothetical protein C0991_009287 [Blastosporella zonata]
MPSVRDLRRWGLKRITLLTLAVLGDGYLSQSKSSYTILKAWRVQDLDIEQGDAKARADGDNANKLEDTWFSALEQYMGALEMAKHMEDICTTEMETYNTNRNSNLNNLEK